MSNWYFRYNSEGAKARVIFLPYAGGSASIYKKWVKALPRDIEAIIVQLPGRANRLTEKPICDMPNLILQLGKALTELNELPYIIFGHSMGSRIGYQLIDYFQRKKLPAPKHFIASGSKAPHQQRHMYGSHLLPEQEFITELKRLNATPREVLENKELLKLCMKILRADFEIADYQCSKPVIPHDIPFTLLFGLFDEEVNIEDIDEWKFYFSCNLNLKLFNGHHFFINSHKQEVIKEINSICNLIEKG